MGHKAPDRHAEKHAKTTSPSLKEALTRQRTVTDQSHASCMSPSSCKSADSAVDYHQPDQTIIILDWDDTLCPSTTCVWEQGLEPCGPEPTGEVAFALRKHSVAALALLREADMCCVSNLPLRGEERQRLTVLFCLFWFSFACLLACVLVC